VQTLLKALLLLFIATPLSANNLLDGKYSFIATIQEAHSHDTYKLKMHLSSLNNKITGDVDYYLDGCSGNITGKVLSNSKIELEEDIKKGSDICANGTYTFNLKYQLISKAKSYLLENKKHSVIINKYSFIPQINVWDYPTLHNEINVTKSELDDLEYQTYKPELLIEKSKKKQKLSKYFLENNTSVFIDGQCTEPLLAPTPKPFFDTQDKAKKYALAYCSVSFGCRVGVELARNKLDTAAKRFLASQSCTMLVRTYQQENTLLDETMFNLLDAVSYQGCGDSGDGFLGGVIQGGSCIMSTATRLARVGQYIECIDSKTEEFHNTYLDWKNEPSKRKNECDTHLKIVSDTPKLVEKYNQKLEIVQSKMNKKNLELQKLEQELQSKELFRQKQEELIKLLNTR